MTSMSGEKTMTTASHETDHGRVVKESGASPGYLGKADIAVRMISRIGCVGGPVPQSDAAVQTVLVEGVTTSRKGQDIIRPRENASV